MGGGPRPGAPSRGERASSRCGEGKQCPILERPAPTRRGQRGIRTRKHLGKQCEVKNSGSSAGVVAEGRWW